MGTKALRAVNAIRSQVWAATEEKVSEIADFTTRVALGERMTKAEARQRFGALKPRTPMRAGQVAVVPLYGTLVSRANQIHAYSGGTSYESYVAAMEAAVAHGDVEAVITDGDSPGGAAEGAREAFQRLLALRGKKPIITVSNYLLASGALWVGSAADEVVASPSSNTGSVGVYTVHTDLTAAAAAAGVKHEVIRSSPNKGRGGAFEPLSDEQRAHVQEMVQDYHRLFVGDLAKAYGTSTAAIEADFGGGWVLTAQRALRAKMVSRIATLEDVLAEYGVTRKPQAGHALTGAQAAALPLHALDGWSASWAPLTRDRSKLVISVPAALRLLAEEMDDAEQMCGKCGGPMKDDGAGGTYCPECEPEMEQEQDDDQASAGGAANATTHPPATEPAPEAKEHAVSETITDLRAAEAQRIKDLSALANEYNASDLLAGWISDGADTGKAAEAVLRRQGEKSRTTTVQPTPGVTSVKDRDERPFASLGQQLIAIRAVDTRSGSAEQINRLETVNRIAAASGSDSRIPADGGWAIQQTFVDGITTKMWETGKVLSRVNKVPIGENSNGLVRNQLKETSRATGSRYGGVRVYRTAEGETVSGSKPALRRQQILLEKLMGIYYATEEILQDASALTVEAERGFRSEMQFVCENEVFRGTGVGQCLGFTSSAALVTVAKETGQTAATVNATNVAKMMSRLPASSFGSAVWYINPSVIPQLVLMTVGNQPVFLPGGSIAGAPFGTLFGMPVEPTEYCEALGTAGDIILSDLSQYTAIDKGGDQWQSSIHVRFLNDETAFKLTYRFNGQPDWESAVTPFKGSDTVSPFITLATRS